jgi:hypothetical protein
MACQKRYVNWMKVLIGAGANGPGRASEGRTPLAYAKEKVDADTYVQLMSVFLD